MSDMKAKIEELVNKAAAAERADDAMKFAQAALNAANAIMPWRPGTEQKVMS